MLDRNGDRMGTLYLGVVVVVSSLWLWWDSADKNNSTSILQLQRSTSIRMTQLHFGQFNFDFRMFRNPTLRAVWVIRPIWLGKNTCVCICKKKNNRFCAQMLYRNVVIGKIGSFLANELIGRPYLWICWQETHRERRRKLVCVNSLHIVVS